MKTDKTTIHFYWSVAAVIIVMMVLEFLGKVYG